MKRNFLFWAFVFLSVVYILLASGAASAVVDDSGHEPVPAPMADCQAQLQLEAGLREALGKSNRGVARLAPLKFNPTSIEIHWRLDAAGSVRGIEQAARGDVLKMLQVLQETDVPFETVFLDGTFPVLDKYGHVEEYRVVGLIYEHNDIERINFDRIALENVYDIAWGVTIHDALFGRVSIYDGMKRKLYIDTE